MQTRADRIAAILTEKFAPDVLRVEDDSARHAGHSGARSGGQTHYDVLVVSETFAGHSRVARHRMVNEALATEFQDGLHALALTLRTPAENTR